MPICTIERGAADGHTCPMARLRGSMFLALGLETIVLEMIPSFRLCRKVFWQCHRLDFFMIAPEDGSIDLGRIQLPPLLRHTAMATEFLHLMIKHAFELGYRRCEWECDALIAPSRRGVLPLGFTFEGVLRQRTHHRGRNRDTAWYSIVDHEWQRTARAHRDWLDASNFDAGDRQIRSLPTIIRQTKE